MKAHELARELNISHKELLNYLQQNRLTRNPAAPLQPAAIEKARTQFKRTAGTATVVVNGERKITLPPSDLTNTATITATQGGTTITATARATVHIGCP